MSVLLAWHLLAVGIWLGCVAAEIVLELDGTAGQFENNFVARIHVALDRFIELPAFLAVAITGLMMYSPSVSDTLLDIKVVLGLAAVALNGLCVYLVQRRYVELVAGNEAGFLRYHNLHTQFGRGVLVTVAGALAIGIYLVQF